MIPETAHSNRRYCGTDECQRYRKSAAAKKAYANNRDARAAQLRQYNREHREDERRRYHQKYRVRKLAKIYNTTMKVIRKVLAITVCEVCGATEDLVIDHNHDTGQIRGRLCHNCNRAIGLLGDDTERLRKAITYLKRRPRWD